MSSESVNESQSEGISIARQSHLVGGVFCLSAVLLGHFVNPNFFYIAVAPAFGLLLDAFTGLCLMSVFLGYAPWNKDKPKGC